MLTITWILEILVSLTYQRLSIYGGTVVIEQPFHQVVSAHTFVIWPHPNINLHLSRISLTQNIENIKCNRFLRLLDLLVTRRPDSTLDHSVYCKHQPVSQKKSVINSLVHKAFSKQTWPGVQQSITFVLIFNEYKRKNIFHFGCKKSRTQTSAHSWTLTLQSTDRIARILKKHIFHTVLPVSYFSKDKLVTLHTEGVYSIMCSREKIYIRDTGRNISTRRKEHQRYVRSWQSILMILAIPFCSLEQASFMAYRELMDKKVLVHEVRTVKYASKRLLAIYRVRSKGGPRNAITFITNAAPGCFVAGVLCIFSKTTNRVESTRSDPPVPFDIVS